MCGFLQHEVLKQCGLPWELEAMLANWLRTEEGRVADMDVVAGRLKREHEKVSAHAHAHAQSQKWVRYPCNVSPGISVGCWLSHSDMF